MHKPRSGELQFPIAHKTNIPATTCHAPSNTPNDIPFVDYFPMYVFTLHTHKYIGCVWCGVKVWIDDTISQHVYN